MKLVPLLISNCLLIPIQISVVNLLIWSMNLSDSKEVGITTHMGVLKNNKTGGTREGGCWG